MVYFMIALGFVVSLFFGLASMSIHIYPKWHHQHGSTCPLGDGSSMSRRAPGTPCRT